MVNKPSLLAALKARNMRLQTKIVDLEEKLISARNRIKALEAERKRAMQAGGPIRVESLDYAKLTKQFKRPSQRHRGKVKGIPETNAVAHNQK